MNITSAKFFGKQPQHSGRRMVRALAAILSVSISTAVPALADTVRVNQVVQSLTSSKGTPDLRLNTLVTQDPSSSGTKGSTPQTQNGPRNDSQAGNQGGTKTESIITVVTGTADAQRIGVDTIEEGEVDGTICDCGEIPVVGGFPKWPFLFLGAVPLVFISTCDTCEESSPTPTPTPTPPSTPTPTPTPTPEIPEPASLLLFGSGLVAAGAGLRRRYTKAKLTGQDNVREEE